MVVSAHHWIAPANRKQTGAVAGVWANLLIRVGGRERVSQPGGA